MSQGTPDNEDRVAIPLDPEEALKALLKVDTDAPEVKPVEKEPEPPHSPSVGSLSELERELIELCGMSPEMGETTTTLDEDMLESSPGRATVEATLRGLVASGLMTTSRARFASAQRVYEDDWWVVTGAGRAAAGLP